MAIIGWRGQYQRYKELFLNIMLLYKKRADLRMFLEIILSLSTIIVFSLFALKPTILTIIDLVKEINKKEEIVTILDKKIADLENARNKIDQEGQIIGVIKSAIPSIPDPEVFVKQIEGIAGKNGAKILGASVGKVTLLGKESESENKSDAEEMSVSISVNGSYPSLIAFARDLENLRRPVKVSSFGINAASSQEEKTLVLIVSGKVPFLELK